MHLCSQCYAVLPEPTDNAHRRRKFCNAACKQKFYRRHNGKRDVHTNKFWQARYEATKEALEVERRMTALGKSKTG